jgi:hypothetical protein
MRFKETIKPFASSRTHTSEEYDKVDGLKSAKEVWDTLFINHKGQSKLEKEVGEAHLGDE